MDVVILAGGKGYRLGYLINSNENLLKIFSKIKFTCFKSGTKKLI